MTKIFFEKTAKLIGSATNGAHSHTNCTSYKKETPRGAGFLM